MERAVDAAIFIDAVEVRRARVIPAGFEFLEGNFVGGIAVNLIGTEKNENRIWTMEPGGLKKIYGAKGIDFEIKDGDIAGFVMGGLRGAMDNQVETLGAKEGFESDAVADVHIVMGEVLGGATQPVQIPGGIAGIAKENLPHVVVDAVDLMALTVEMLDGFRANKAAGTGTQDYFW